MKLTVDQGQFETIVAALEVARDSYKIDAINCNKANERRLAEQFQRQEQKCRDMLDLLSEQEANTPF